MMQVVCKLTSAAGTANEDLAGAIGQAAWLLDGATGLIDKPLLDAPSDASWLVARLGEMLETSLDSEKSMASILEHCAQGLARAFAMAAVRTPSDVVEYPAASLAIVRAGDGAVHLANIGDCDILYRTDGGPLSAFGSSHVRELDRQVVAFLTRLRGDRAPYAQIWPAIKKRILQNRRLANVPDGYWVADVTSRWLPHVQYTQIAYSQVCDVVLLTDGISRLYEIYQAVSREELFDQLLTGKGDESLRRLRAIEDDDAECFRFPRIKPRDDATVIAVRFSRPAKTAERSSDRDTLA